jgi:hypothetical protein
MPPYVIGDEDLAIVTDAICAAAAASCAELERNHRQRL